MAEIIASKPLDEKQSTVTVVDLSTGPHSFTYESYKQILRVHNQEAGDITLNLLGDGVTQFDSPRLGLIDVSGGYDFVVPAGETRTLYTHSIDGYFGSNGATVNVNITGATGASFASIEQY